MEDLRRSITREEVASLIGTAGAARNIERSFEALAGHRHGEIYSFFYTKHTDPERAKTWLLNKARRDKATYTELLEIFACYYEKYYLQKADAGEKIPAGVVIDGILKVKLENVDLYSLPEEVASALYYIQLAKAN